MLSGQLQRSRLRILTLIGPTQISCRILDIYVNFTKMKMVMVEQILRLICQVMAELLQVTLTQLFIFEFRVLEFLMQTSRI